jgi:molecular chaperone GrpE
VCVDAYVVSEETRGDDGVHGDAEPAAPAAEADPLAEALRERDEYLALAQRARADFENYRRRVASQTAEAEQRGRATLARNLLPAIDNLQRALAAAGVDPANADDADGLGKGVALVYGELLGALERDGVVPFDPTGEAFDPNMHEAITTAPAEGVDAGTVLETLELGYRVDKQVIRPARVVVSG